VNSYLTTAQAAKLVAVGIDKVHDWIHDGSLPAFNLARHGGGRPRWRIRASDLDDFLLRRRSQSIPPPRRRRKRPEGVIEFY
jgi:excisionase family DNA binding protein